MSYVRRHSLGAIEDLGAGPAISGDPVVALVAQLNRFAGKTVAPGNCQGRRVLSAPFPLASGLTSATATAAVLVLMSRYECVPIDTFSKRSYDWATKGLDNPVAFVTSNLTEVTTTIAQFGDRLGYAPASVGITQRDPRFTPSFPIGTAAIVAGLGLAVLLLRRKR